MSWGAVEPETDELTYDDLKPTGDDRRQSVARSRLSEGECFSKDPYARLKGSIQIQRGSAKYSVQLDHHVHATLANGSCGFHTMNGSVKRGVQSGELDFDQYGLKSDQIFQKRLRDVVLCAGDAGARDLTAGPLRKLLCTFGLTVLLSDEDAALRGMLLKNWTRIPDDDLYQEAKSIAEREQIKTDFPCLDRSIELGCMNVVCILSPRFYFEATTFLLLQQYLLGKIAFVSIVDNGTEPVSRNLLTRLNTAGKGKRSRDKTKSEGETKRKAKPRQNENEPIGMESVHVRFAHTCFNDFVHPTASVFWFPFLQRERHGASNHFELLVPLDGSCPMQPIPGVIDDLESRAASEV